MGFYQQNAPHASEATTWRAWLEERPQLPYLLPFLGFVVVMLPGMAFGKLGGIDWQDLWFTYQPLVYTVKTVVGAVLLVVFWRYYTPIRWRHLGVGVLLGLLGVPLWVGLEMLSQRVGWGKSPDPHLPHTIYNPLVQIPDFNWRLAYYIIRVGGPTLVVPIMEELFFRDFLMRFLIRGPRFQDVDVGTFTWWSLLGMSLLFAINHVQQPSGFAYGLLMGILIIRTKSLGACIVAHGVTNFALYLLVIWQGTLGHDWGWQGTLGHGWWWQFM
jgi:CAAX prenyl protease-like protein